MNDRFYENVCLTLLFGHYFITNTETVLTKLHLSDYFDGFCLKFLNTVLAIVTNNRERTCLLLILSKFNCVLELVARVKIVKNVAKNY